MLIDIISSMGEKIGDGSVAEVYARDGKAIKLYKHHIAKQEAFYEALINTAIEATGLPVPKVFGVYQFGGRWAMEMELLEGSMLGTFIKEQPAERIKYLDIMVDMHTRIHNIKDLPAIISQKQKIKGRIQNTEVLGISKKDELIAELKNMPDGGCLCHGDYHYENLMMSNGKVFIIDWVDATIGNPAADACRTYMLLKMYAPDIADSYIEKYSCRSGIPFSTIKAWLPLIAAARLDEGKSNEREQLLKWIGGV